jgi:hypothetical protein
MRYLGGIRGAGTLALTDGQALGPVEYDIDGFVNHTGEVVGSGELRMQPALLGAAFGRRDLCLRTDDGQTLELRFSGSQLAPNCAAAHVDVTSGFPAPRKRSPQPD